MCCSEQKDGLGDQTKIIQLRFIINKVSRRISLSPFWPPDTISRPSGPYHHVLHLSFFLLSPSAAPTVHSVHSVNISTPHYHSRHPRFPPLFSVSIRTPFFSLCSPFLSVLRFSPLISVSVRTPFLSVPSPFLAVQSAGQFSALTRFAFN